MAKQDGEQSFVERLDTAILEFQAALRAIGRIARWLGLIIAGVAVVIIGAYKMLPQ